VLLAGEPLDLGELCRAFSGSLGLWSALAVGAFALVKLYRQDSQRARLGRIVLAMSVLAGVGLAASLADGYEPLVVLSAAVAGWVAASWLDYRLRIRYDEVSQAWVVDRVLEARTLLIGSAKQVAIASPALRALSRPTKIVGFLTLGEPSSAPNCLGTTADLGRVAVEECVGRVVIVDTTISPQHRQELADRCHLLGLCVEAVPSIGDVRSGGVELIAGQPLVLLPLPPLWQGDPGFFAKRALDVSLVAIALVLLSPILVAISLATWAMSGRVITRSWRHGLGDTVFGMYRFCTTKRDVGGAGDPSDPDNDHSREPTALGAWLRHRGLDELPQLFNVLLGQMSLVGPRPLPVLDHSRLEGEQLLRYVVVPGVTSPWQVCSRQVLTHAELASLDIAYLCNWSILLDLEILVKTARLMVRGRSELPRLVDGSDLGTETSAGRESSEGVEHEVGKRRSKKRRE
jgi:lipopolysaccharide/colanic/teichoic acid biosynthesis glycosyltransferase